MLSFGRQIYIFILSLDWMQIVLQQDPGLSHYCSELTLIFMPMCFPWQQLDSKVFMQVFPIFVELIDFQLLDSITCLSFPRLQFTFENHLCKLQLLQPCSTHCSSCAKYFIQLCKNIQASSAILLSKIAIFKRQTVFGQSVPNFE